MKRERTITSCFNRETRQSEPQLSALYLKAENDADSEFLEMLNSLMEARDANPERVAFVLESIREPELTLDERVEEKLDKLGRKWTLAEAAPNN